MSVVLYLILAILGLGYLWVKYRYTYFDKRGFKSAKPDFIFGSLKGVGNKKAWFEALDEIYKDFKGKAPAVGFYSFMDPTILPIDPEIFKNVLVRDFSSFHDRGFYSNKEDDPISVHLLSLDGQDWRDRRVKLSPIFTSGKMKMMFEIVDLFGDKLLNAVNKELRSSDELNVNEWAAKFTADVIGNVAFGLECKCLEDQNSEFFKHSKRVANLTGFELIKFFFANSFPEMSRKLHITTNPKEPADFFMNSFLETFEYRQKNDVKRNDFVALLLGLKDHYTPVELAGESFLVFSGGSETSSTLVTFTCYELALNLDIQQRLRDEIVSGLEENHGKLTYDMLIGFKYLDMVVSESLRKYPPIPGAIRKCTKDYTIPGTSLTIEKGTAVQLLSYSIQRDPEHYPEPEKFDPERFSPENSKARNPFTYLPFSEGPRNCIGMRFGLMQSKLAILKLVSKFEMTPTSKTPIPMKFIPSSPFLSPVGGMWLKLKKIEA